MGTVSENGDLHLLLRESISTKGPITFAEFMDTVLYHSSFGYYTRSTGAPADYFTSVSAHPVFGAMLANHLDDLWIALDRPNPFAVIELGAGEGILADHILSVAREHEWASCLWYAGVEISASRRSAAPIGTQFASTIYELECMDLREAVIISNEYFDALPFHLLRRQETGWVEERVAIRDGEFAFVDTEPAPHVLRYAEQYGDALPDGGRLEARPMLSNLYSEIAGIAPVLAMTTIDYGGLAPEVHGPRLQAGTALAYRAHEITESLLTHLGAQDLTAHVNFTSLTDAGHSSGLDSFPLIKQVDFLAALGVGDYLPYLQTIPGVTPERYERERHAVIQLLDPAEMGRFRVLFQYRGLNFPTLRGF
jgi:SAM-dependent MidA family methyltransferase